MMSDEHAAGPAGLPKPDKAPPPHGRHRRRILFPALAVALAIGAAGGAGAMKLLRPAPEMAAMLPVSIAAMPTSGLVTIKGTAAEIYGNKFILQDDSGRTLVDTGPAGDGSGLVGKGDLVTVQGRFDDGFVHASYLIGKDGKAEALGPAGPPPPHRMWGPGGPPPPPAP